MKNSNLAKLLKYLNEGAILDGPPETTAADLQPYIHIVNAIIKNRPLFNIISNKKIMAVLDVVDIDTSMGFFTERISEMNISDEEFEQLLDLKDNHELLSQLKSLGQMPVGQKFIRLAQNPEAFNILMQNIHRSNAN